jgi:hypothetical protein
MLHNVWILKLCFVDGQSIAEHQMPVRRRGYVVGRIFGGLRDAMYSRASSIDENILSLLRELHH